MPHIHRLYDFVVSVFIVFRGRVLFIYHKNHDRWLPIGGHIELDEDPEQALYREIQEECGLKVRILASRPPVAHEGVKAILRPSFVDCHDIGKTHKHIAFVYVGKASSSRVQLHTGEHAAFEWLAAADLEKKKYGLTRSLKYYARYALRAAGGTRRG